jgi:hypothetical protein
VIQGHLRRYSWKFKLDEDVKDYRRHRRLTEGGGGGGGGDANSKDVDLPVHSVSHLRSSEGRDICCYCASLGMW